MTAANPLGQSPSSYSDHSILTGPRSPRDQESYNPSRGASVGEQSSLSIAPNDHIHWCVTCKIPQAIKTCGGFKRHMREHQTRFYCKLQGPVVPTEDGTKCAFCDVLNPDSRHLNTHNVKLCVKKPPVARSYPRRDLFLNHLKKKHNVSDGSVLAEQSKHTIHQKFFACGFCVSWFGSLNEQVNHIDAAHYRLSKHIRDWDLDKVIRSLLSRPGMNEHWQRTMAANPRFQEPLFSWDPTGVEQLQRRLEMSLEPEDVLCRAAIDESNYGRSQHGMVESVPVTGLTDLEMDTSQLMQPSQHQNVWSPPPSNHNQDSTAHAPPTRAPTLQSQQLGWNWEDHNDWDWNGTYGSRAVPQIASAADTAQSWKGHIGTSHSSRLGGYSQGLSSNISNDPRPRQGFETRTHPAQARTSDNHPTLLTQQTPLPPSRFHPTSHSSHILGPFDPAYHSTSDAQPQGQDLTDHHQTDMDDDFNNMQRPIQDQGDGRRQRRPH
ncbi:MAG: hypothetical protein ASARMPREDX12_009373 [Alectoria sarmentosa]|nr:MAG: hypothetical protein ASARMPREDX12_009373 [Alectoria sarmentosa]